MIRTRFLRSFDETLKALSPQEAARVEAAIRRLLEYFGGGEKPLGLGLSKLKRTYWEIRAGLDKRIFFSLEGDRVTFILIGNHDEIRRYLRSL